MEAQTYMIPLKVYCPKNQWPHLEEHRFWMYCKASIAHKYIKTTVERSMTNSYPLDNYTNTEAVKKQLY